MNMTKKSILMAVFFLYLFVHNSSATNIRVQIISKAPEYFKAMEDAIIEIILENQALINQNPDGSMKTEELLPQQIFDATYKTFNEVVKNFDKKELTSKKLSPKRTTYLLTSLLQAARITIARSQKAIDTESDGSIKLKKFIPAVFGLQVTRRVMEKTDLKLKQTTLGKNQLTARNPDNAPDKWETRVLKKFLIRIWKGDRGFAQRTTPLEYRFMKPIHIKNACLVCHGSPVGEISPYGHKKEGYQEGEVRGGISITIPIK